MRDGWSVRDRLVLRVTGTASRTAVATLRDFLQTAMSDHDFTWPFGFDEHLNRYENLIQSGSLLANHKICTFAQDNPELLGMGTTLAVLFAQGDEIVIAHVGDSRIYRMRQGALQLLTIDHSWVNEQLQRNVITEQEARHHRWRNVITRALGNRFDIQIDLQSLPGQGGDLFLLCSDGLTSMVDDAALVGLLRENDGNLETACNTLIDAANQAGGLDNISVILVRVLP